MPPALAEYSCGCFLPDLTRLTIMQCGEARRKRFAYIMHAYPLTRYRDPAAIFTNAVFSVSMIKVRMNTRRGGVAHLNSRKI